MKEGERGGDREREREREGTHAGEREKERKSACLRGWGGSGGRERERVRALTPPFICFFPPPGPALCKLGLAKSAVCSS